MDSHRFLFHGSCTRCHHFHQGVDLWLPLTDDTHSRCSCESCGHPMFGIGRSSPQSSLASLLTNLPTQSESVALGSAQLQDISVSEAVSRPSDDQITIIRGNQIQERSLGNSSQTSATNAEPIEHRAHLEPRLIPNRSTREKEQSPVRRAVPGHAYDPQRSHPSSHTYSLHHTKSAARKFFERIRPGKLWQRFKNGQHVDKHQSVIRPVIQDTHGLIGPFVDLTLDPNAGSIFISQTPTIAVSTADEPQPSTPNVAQRQEESSSLTIEAQALAIKLSRIQAQRKEATLKDKFAKRSTCPCGEGCHCRDEGSYPTTTAQLPSRPLSLSNSYQLLLDSPTSSSSPTRGRMQHDNSSRHVAFTENHREPSIAPYPDRITSIEDDEQQQVSRRDTATSISATSQVTTAVNSSISGSARNNGFPILSDQQIQQLVALFRLDANRRATREAVRVLNVARRHAELSTSQHWSQNAESRTNSMSVASDAESSARYYVANRINSISHDSTASLSHFPEQNNIHMNHSDIHDTAAVGRTHSSSDATVQPHSPQNGHLAATDQLSTDLEQLLNHNEH